MAHVTLDRFVRKQDVPQAVLRIIPHHSVLNSSNHKFVMALYEMFSIKFPKYPWEHKRGFHVAIRSNPNFWWVIQMKAGEEDAKHIGFYIAMPVDFVDSFKTKLKNHEQWKRSTIEEVTDFEFPQDEHTDLYKLKYERHDMFSLSYKFTEQHTPIRDIMTLSNELREGESLSIFIRNEAVDRRKWRKLVDYAWEEWDKGGIMYRAEFDIARVARSIIDFSQTVAFEIKTIVSQVITGIERSFFSKSQGQDIIAPQVRPQSPERAMLLVNGELNARTREKRNLPSFKTSIRYAVTSAHNIRREVIARAVETSLSDLNGDNRLKALKITIRPKQELESLRHWEIKEMDTNIMSVDEVSKLQQLPTKELQQEFHNALESNQKVEVEIPAPFLDTSGIFMGTSTMAGSTFDVYWPTKDRDITFTPRGFIGSPRMGKDQDCINFIVEANLKHGIGAVIPDVIDERNGHRGMSDAIRDHLPPENIIDLNLGDFDWPIYLGLDSLVKSAGNDRIASNFISQYLTNFLMGDDVENHQTREHLREFAKAVNGDLIGIKLFCLAPAFRNQVINQLREEGWDTLPLESFHKNEGRQTSISGPILVRLGELLGDEFLKPIFGQKANPDVDLGKWMSEGKVVVIRIPSRKLGELAVKTIVHWISMLTLLTGISMDGKGNPGCYLVLNEPHQFLSKGMIHFCKRMLMEGPKYRMAPIFLYHNPALLPREFNEILMSSSINWHIFKNSSSKVYEDLAPYLAPTFTPETAMAATQRFHFIACWLNSEGAYQTPFMVKAPDMVGDRFPTMDNSKLTETHSRQYGRHIKEVLDYIQERQRVIYAQK